MKLSRVLVLSPHPDDAELGCGGTIARFREEGKEVHVVVFTVADWSLPLGSIKGTRGEESCQASQALGIDKERLRLLDYSVRNFPAERQKMLDELLRIGDVIKPNLVLLPCSTDQHQDHQTVHAEGLRAFKRTCSLWGYEEPWNTLTFTADVFVRLDRRHVDAKLAALRQYATQDARPYMEPEFVSCWSRTRGLQASWQFAEAFEMLRLLV